MTRHPHGVDRMVASRAPTLRTANGHPDRTDTLEEERPVTEAWINLNSQTSAVRLMFKSVTGRRAVGLGQLCLTVEAASRAQIAEGQPIWVGWDSRGQEP